MLDEHLLLDLAGEPAFARGVGYYRDRLVTLSRQSPTEFEGYAEGTSRYRPWYRENGAAFSRYFGTSPKAVRRAGKP